MLSSGKTIYQLPDESFSEGHSDCFYEMFMFVFFVVTTFTYVL
jgi:hypothetical protein